MVAKQTAELAEILEQKIAWITSTPNNSSRNAAFIASFQTMERRVSSIQHTNPTKVGESAAFELDTHADTSVLGNIWREDEFHKKG